MKRPVRVFAAAAALLLSSAAPALLLAGAASAQQFPAKPLRLILAFPPGASMDLSARAIAQKLGEGLAQPVVVDNRPGGNTIVAADIAAHSPPDGYTLFMALDSTLTVIPAVYSKVPYDPLRDFAPVTLFSRGSYTFVAHPKVPYRSLGELVAWARANPGKLNVGASTVLTQILSLELKKAAGVDITYVPYKGTPPMFQALLAGDVDLVIDAIPIYLPQIKAGKMVALATTGPTRSIQLPDSPTSREAGFPTLEVATWTAIFAPGGTPAPIVSRLNAEMIKVMNNPDFRQKMQDAGQNPLFSSTPAELSSMVKADLERWAPLIKAAGIKLE